MVGAGDYKVNDLLPIQPTWKGECLLYLRSAILVLSKNMSSCVLSLTRIATIRESITKSEKNVNDLPELIKYLQV